MKELLTEARECYDSLSEFRRKRNRCRDYTFGRQWNDLIEVDGRRITEYEYIMREGNIPLKNNLIRRIVRNVLGVFRKEMIQNSSEFPSEFREMDNVNDIRELYCRTMEEFLISGLAVHRKRLTFRDGKPSVITDIVSPSSFFFNTSSTDVRGSVVTMVGQMHEVDFSQWCEAFVNSRESYRNAVDIFKGSNRRLKVTEVWKREFRPRYLVHDSDRGYILRCEPEDLKLRAKPGMKKRWIIDDVWRYYFLTDDGTLLRQGDSPYIHRKHPFVFKGYPFLDGEIQSFVGDMIDQQRYANRLITLYDWVIRASAKGVLMLPQGAVEPEQMQNVADQWGRFNGVIVYKSQPGVPDPHQVSGNTGNLGIAELLDIQLKMLEDVSGVNGALRGNLTSHSVSGTLYNQQTENAMNSLSDILGTFKAFMQDCRRLDRALLSQITG